MIFFVSIVNLMFIGQYSIQQKDKQILNSYNSAEQMKKTSLSQQKQLKPFTMDRKATIKKHSDTLTFSIYQNSNRMAKIQISPQSTVGQLLGQVKQQLGLNSKDFIGLTSRDNNEMIDYTLKMKHFVLGSFGNNMEFEIQRRGEVLNDNEPSLGDFQFLKLLGSGVSASVYLVRHRCNGMLYAMKQIKKSYFKQFKRMQQVLRQRKIMIQMIGDLPFTTRLIGSFQSEKFLNFVIEYYPGGEMFFHLQKRRLYEEEAKLYVAEMVVTFQRLHERKVIYRDLKPENIMIDFEGHARLGDFGLCRLNLEYYDLTYSYCGSQQYMAPQVKSQSGYNYSVDFYTLGSFAYELVTGVPPYYNNQQLTFPSTATNQYIQLVTKLIESNMHKRLKSFGEIKRLKWFKTIEWKKIIEKRYQMPFRLDIAENYIGEEFKHQVVDPEILQEQQFDKLLQCFFYISEDKGGFSQFYGRKKDTMKRMVDSSHKKKKFSFEISNDHNQNHSRKSSHSKTSQHSSHSKTSQLSLKPNSKVFKKNPLPNIYTSNLAQKSSKKLLNLTQTSRSKSHKKISNNSQDKNNMLHINKLVKKPQKVGEKPQKITMKKVKSSSNLIGSGNNTYNKVMELRNVFSPMMKMVSPKKPKPTQL